MLWKIMPWKWNHCGWVNLGNVLIEGTNDKVFPGFLRVRKSWNFGISVKGDISMWTKTNIHKHKHTQKKQCKCEKTINIDFIFSKWVNNIEFGSHFKCTADAFFEASESNNRLYQALSSWANMGLPCFFFPNLKIKKNASCWWFRNPKQPLGMYKILLNSWINYQPQLVI